MAHLPLVLDEIDGHEVQEKIFIVFEEKEQAACRLDSSDQDSHQGGKDACSHIQHDRPVQRRSYEDSLVFRNGGASYPSQPDQHQKEVIEPQRDAAPEGGAATQSSDEKLRSQQHGKHEHIQARQRRHERDEKRYRSRHDDDACRERRLTDEQCKRDRDQEGNDRKRPLSSDIRETHKGLLAIDSHHALFRAHGLM